jgi:polysaccharide deacetylase family protein (PEP-CTERM system associated)
MPNHKPMLNALTVDVEDYFHVTAFEGQVSRHEWDQYPSRVVPNTQRILRLLERHQARGTFFVLGWVAHRFPGLVRDIAAAGHEIGCHSYWHRLIYRMTPDDFRQDLRQAQDAIENACGRRIQVYRAPSWSITRRSLWALEILADEGIRYDSSIFPIYHDRYGIPEADLFPHAIEVGPRRLMEFPPSVIRVLNLNLPVSGGGYFRLYPASWTAFCVARVNGVLHQPFMFYLHPWELDPGQPRLSAPFRVRWRHYLNLASTEKKFDVLLSRFRFGPLTEVLDAKSQEPKHAPEPHVNEPGLALR